MKGLDLGRDLGRPCAIRVWQSRNVREGSDYKRAADSFSYGTSASQPMNRSTAGMLAHPD